VVVVDRKFDIYEINSAARRLLSIHTVAVGEDFVHLAQHISPRELGTAITRAIRDNVGTTLEVVEVPHLTTGEANFLKLECFPHPVDSRENGPVSNEGAGGQFALILVTDVTAIHQSQRNLAQAHAQQIKLTGELSQSLDTLQGTNRELQQINTELLESNTALAQAKLAVEETARRHARQMELLVEANRNLLSNNDELTNLTATLRMENEEYLMHSEEAQAAIEETETLNEEVQATNEELETLNEELQSTIEELNTSNADLAVQSDGLRSLTEELQLQREQSDRERVQLAALLASMADAVVVVDLACKVRMTNPAYDEMFPTGKEIVLLDETYEKELRAEDRPLARAARGERFNMAFNFRLADGNQRWLEALGQPVHGDDNTTWGLVVLRDITDRSLRHLQRQFLSLVGHELRNPLTVIKGYSGMVKRWLEKPSEDSTRQLISINQVLIQTSRLERLIDELVDVGRLQNVKFSLHLTRLDLVPLLEQVVQNGRLLTTGQSIEFDSPNEPFLINGDEARLEQLFLNLIKNAIVHASSSPKIKLCLQRLNSNQLEVKLQDYGPGIEAEYLPNLFTRFYQGMHRNKTQGKGLGLGLYISQQIVKAHGGTLSVASTVGKGTTFIVQLPLLVDSANSEGQPGFDNVT
jgi:two-component system CheB/CheR fusion protein